VAAGLNPSKIDEIMTTIRYIHHELGITVFLIEHVMELVMRVSERIIVLDYGQKISDGSPEVIVKDPQVIRAYFGERYVEEHGDTSG
tara:strand:- start:261 stop:521 length:261 start_codon:yes stop_codon:yes gene_type:complete